MRRLNRGLFQVAMSQVALENEEVVPTGVTPPAEVVEKTPESAVVPTEVSTDAGTVEVTIKVDSAEPVVIEKTESSVAQDEPAVAAVVAQTETPVDAAVTTGTTEVIPTETMSAEDKIKALEAEIAKLKSGAVTTESDELTPSATETPPAAEPAEIPTEVAPVDAVAAPDVVAAEPTATEATVVEGETVLVKTEGGEVVATVNTTETGTTVTTAEVTVEVEQTGDSTSVEVTVTPDETSAISTEDLTVIETDGNETEVEIQDAVDSAEDTAELMSEIDEAEEAAMTLESFVEISQAAASNGGLDSHGARLLKVATEHIYNHMSLDDAVGIPAMESFEIPGARASATTIALEDIRGQAKVIWQAVVEGIKKAIEWIQEFVKKIFSANARIKSRAEKLLAASEKMSGTPKSRMVGDAALVKSLSLGGRIPSNLAAEVKKAVDFFAGTTDGRTFKAIWDTLDIVKQAATTGDADKAEAMVFEVISTIAGKGLQFNNVSNSLAAKTGIPEAPVGTTISMSIRFCGEQVVWAYMPSSVEAITSFRSGIGVDATTVKIADGAQVKTLMEIEISNVAKQALAFVEASKKFEELQAPLKQLTTIVSETLIINTSDSSDSKANAFKAVIPALRAIRHLVKGIHQPAAVVAARVVNASLNLATASAKQYSMKAA